MRKLLIPLSVAILAAQPAARFDLSVDSIMRGPGLVGYEPQQVRWAADNEHIYFAWKLPVQKEDAPPDTYVVSRDGSGLRKLSDDEARLAPPVSGETSRDHRATVFVREGDIFVYDHASDKTRQVTRTNEPESNPRFLTDGKRISFVRANNLYVLSLDSGMLVQMTDIRTPPPPGAPPLPPPPGERPKGTASQEYLRKEQKSLFDVVNDRETRREEDEARQKQVNPRKPYTLEPRQTVSLLQLSPDEKNVVAIFSQPPADVKNTIVPSFVTDSAYTEDIPGRPNVGDSRAKVRLALIGAETGEVKWVDHGQKDRDVQILPPVWSQDGTKAVLLAHAADNKDRWVLALDPATAKTRVLATDHDPAWIGGPRTNTSSTDVMLGWLKNDREAYFVSERTGWAHLYAVPYEGGEPRALTEGKWEIWEIQQAQDKSHLYLTATKESPYEQHLYEIPGDGGPLTRLTAAKGKHGGVVSPDGRWIADVYSYTNKPPELYVQENNPQSDIKKLTASPATDFAQYSWLDAPIITFRARDGVQVPARLFKPAKWARGGPGVIFVHGAGYTQNVALKWSPNYYREYMFHHLLMERGFIVIDVDYRGSAGYGRDWRTAIYDHMGGKDLDDIVDAAKYLVSDHGADPKKIGLYGGSYGGFMTLMAMFTQPGVFAAGAALRPVTDWAMYNHEYTSNILNLPQTDSEAYHKSSPIYFAEGLKGALLICHGMVDTNVEFQDTVRVVERLIELRKENWQLAVYPVENHGFVRPASWADEYKRILALFEKNLK
jgi:dipeptidyl aminopeptidase/acylaminoacyl peptidase